MVMPPQTFPGNIKVLAIEDYTERVFELNLLPGKSVKFKRKLMNGSAVVLGILKEKANFGSVFLLSL